jgi:hypothetical protein
MKTLQELVNEDDYDGVKCYIELGGSINMHHEWALRHAVYKGNVKIAKLLIQNGADYDVALNVLWYEKCYNGISCLLRAVCPD